MAAWAQAANSVGGTDPNPGQEYGDNLFEHAHRAAEEFDGGEDPALVAEQEQVRPAGDEDAL